MSGGRQRRASAAARSSGPRRPRRSRATTGPGTCGSCRTCSPRSRCEPRAGAWYPPEALPTQFGESRGAEGCRLDDARRTFEERFVRAALVRTGGHRGRAASELGVTRQGLTKLMTRLGIGDR
ncbi:MAG: hypothetical protein EXQ59_06185 [Acidobacteria bacterium]|nr:hypothetical protein [Acidobacteriota bacterium]